MVLSLSVTVTICAICVFIVCVWSVYKLYRKKPSTVGEEIFYHNGLEYVPPSVSSYSLI